MKRFLSILLGILMMLACFAFTGCEEFFADETSESSSTEQNEETEQKPSTQSKYDKRLDNSTALKCTTEGATFTWIEKIRAWDIKGFDDGASYRMYFDMDIVRAYKEQGKTAIRITFDTRVASQLAWLEVIGTKADGTGQYKFVRINNSGPLTTDPETLDIYFEMSLNDENCDYSKDIFIVMVNRTARIYLQVV